MVYTRLKYLIEPNPEVYIYGSHGSFTFGHRWAPVENIVPWEGFADLKTRFLAQLSKETSRDSLPELTEFSKFNHVYGEASLNQLVGPAIIMPVSLALPQNLFITNGEQTTTDKPDLRPDWGAGSEKRKTASGKYWPIVCGDTKIGWPVFEALQMIRTHPDGYESSPQRALALPLEQVQNYCLEFDTPYGFILTESYLVVLCFILSSDTIRSPQPVRTTRTHGRMLSTSTASTSLVSSFSDMSFEPSPVHRHVGQVKVSVFPWDAPKKDITIKLALWLLIMLARDHEGLKQEGQSPSGPVEGKKPSRGDGTKPSKSKGKGKAPA